MASNTITLSIKLDPTFSPAGTFVWQSLPTTGWDPYSFFGVYASKESGEHWTVGCQMDDSGKQVRAVFSYGETGNKTFQDYGEWITIGEVGSSSAYMTGYPQNTAAVITDN